MAVSRKVILDAMADGMELRPCEIKQRLEKAGITVSSKTMNGELLGMLDDGLLRTIKFKSSWGMQRFVIVKGVPAPKRQDPPFHPMRRAPWLDALKNPPRDCKINAVEVTA